jgi:glycosyltransferase involved in cell wall biosynthesis
MVLAEAFAFATPVAVSDIGALSSIVQKGVNGVVFRPADSGSLTREVRDAWETPRFLEMLSEGAGRSFRDLYTTEVNYRSLIQIYENAIARSGAGGIRR